LTMETITNKPRRSLGTTADAHTEETACPSTSPPTCSPPPNGGGTGWVTVAQPVPQVFGLTVAVPG